MFFETPHNKQALENYIRKASAASLENENLREKNNLSLEIIRSINNNPSRWDSRCAFNIKNIGDYFIEGLLNYTPHDDEKILKIYSYAFRFLCEFDFLIGEGKELSFDLSQVNNKIINDALSKNDDASLQIRYAAYRMPIAIMKNIVNDPRLKRLQDAESLARELDEKYQRWSDELNKKKDDVESLKEALETYQHGFNFVGLHQGFSALHQKKKDEHKWLLRGLFLLGLCIVAPLFCELIFNIKNFIQGIEATWQSLFIWLPIVSIEIILIYFFRIVLLNHRSVAAQILQIELRMSLCQFIQSYVDYARDANAAGSNATLAQFERIVFSNIQADPEKLPNTFDGLEQIAALIKNIKNG